MTKEFIFNFAMQHPLVTLYVIIYTGRLMYEIVNDICNMIRASVNTISETIIKCKRIVDKAEKKSIYSGDSIGFKCMKSPD